MLKRLLLLSVALLAVMAAPVAAQTGYPTTAGTAVGGAQSIQVTGEGCPPNAPITYEYSGPESGSGTATANPSGSYSFQIGGLEPGDYTVTVNCGGQAVVLNATVGRATPATPATPGGPGTSATPAIPASRAALPRTGSDSSVPLAQLGFGAVAVGAVAVYGAKRRKAKAFA